MNEQAIVIFCICDEVVKSFDYQDDPQYKMTTAEVMTFALISAMHYRADYHITRLVSMSLRYFPKILSHSRLVRRIHIIPDCIWWMVFQVLQTYLRKSESECFIRPLSKFHLPAKIALFRKDKISFFSHVPAHCLKKETLSFQKIIDFFKQSEFRKRSIVDSFPVKVYENHKSYRAKIFRGKEFHGYTASKKQYFFGIKVHMIVDETGIPIEFCLTSGSTSDIAGLKELSCALPKGSILFADKAYNSYSLEDDLEQMAEIRLVPKRRKNLTRQHSFSLQYILNSTRNRIETVFSSIVSRMPRCIRARTEKGLYLKVTFFIRPLSKFHLPAKIALFRKDKVSFFSHVPAHCLKKETLSFQKIIDFFKQSEFRKRSIIVHLFSIFCVT